MSIPADLPVIILGNHCDMQHHRQVHAHHIDQALYNARAVRTAPIRYAESSMRNGFGLRILHKFLSVPFLRLQKTSLLEQLQRNQKDTEVIEKELDDFQKSDESDYDAFVDKLVNKRRQSTETEPRVNNERSPSIVLGAGKPIVPPSVNPLLAQSLSASFARPQQNVGEDQISLQTHFVSQQLINPKGNRLVSMDVTPSKVLQDSGPSTPSATNVSVSTSSGALDEFYAGTLDSSFLEDLPPISHVDQQASYDSDSDDGNIVNPRVTVDQDDIDIDSPSLNYVQRNDNHVLGNVFAKQLVLGQTSADDEDVTDVLVDRDACNNEYPLWAGDSSARRSPEGGEDSDGNKEAETQKDKKHKKKKTKDKEDGDKTERKLKKHRRKRSKGERVERNQQQDLLDTSVAPGLNYNYDEYDSI
ncbi:rab-like protein 6 isoform X2 [Leptidea sinapis]|nr:rab-like protein 6 isoform X2 [Leptidea sinapis]